MGVAFNTIVSGIRTPTSHFEADSSRALQGLNVSGKRILVMGIQLASGTATPLVPTQIISGDQADELYGVGSQLASSIRAARYANPSTEMWACGIAELTGGTAATFTLTVTGTSTAAGTLHAYIAGVYVPVAIPSSTAAADVATALNAAIQAHSGYTRMPFTSSATTTVTTLTQKWKGVETAEARFNYNGEAFPAGISSP